MAQSKLLSQKSMVLISHSNFIWKTIFVHSNYKCSREAWDSLVERSHFEAGLWTQTWKIIHNFVDLQVMVNFVRELMKWYRRRGITRLALKMKPFDLNLIQKMNFWSLIKLNYRKLSAYGWLTWNQSALNEPACWSRLALKIKQFW